MPGRRATAARPAAGSAATPRRCRTCAPPPPTRSRPAEASPPPRRAGPATSRPTAGLPPPRRLRGDSAKPLGRPLDAVCRLARYLPTGAGPTAFYARHKPASRSAKGGGDGGDKKELFPFVTLSTLRADTPSRAAICRTGSPRARAAACPAPPLGSPLDGLRRLGGRMVAARASTGLCGLPRAATGETLDS